MDTRFWGPSAWRLIHLIAFSDHRSPDVYTFLEELPHILPCRFCRLSLAEYYTHRPVPKTELARWSYEIHNDVNNNDNNDNNNPEKMNDFISNLMDPFANYNKVNKNKNKDLYYDDYRILYDIDTNTRRDTK